MCLLYEAGGVWIESCKNTISLVSYKPQILKLQHWHCTLRMCKRKRQYSRRRAWVVSLAQRESFPFEMQVKRIRGVVSSAIKSSRPLINYLELLPFLYCPHTNRRLLLLRRSLASGWIQVEFWSEASEQLLSRESNAGATDVIAKRCNAKTVALAHCKIMPLNTDFRRNDVTTGSTEHLLELKRSIIDSVRWGASRANLFVSTRVM